MNSRRPAASLFVPFSAAVVLLIAAVLAAAPAGGQGADQGIDAPRVHQAIVERAAQDGTISATPGSLSRVVHQAAPGTTILLEPGVYEPIQIWSKTDLTIRAATPQTAIFTADSYENDKGFNIADSTRIVIDGISVERTKWGITVRNSTDVTISNTKIHDVGQRGIWVYGDSRDVTIVGSVINTTGQRQGERANGTAYSTLGEAIYVGSGTNPDDATNAVFIRGNVISNTTAEAIDIKTGTFDVKVASNSIRNIDTRTGAIAIHPSSVESSATGIVVSGNVVSAVRSSNGRGGTGIFVSGASSVDANLVFDSEGDGIELSKITGSERQVTYRNNTVFGSGGEDYRVAPHQAGIPEPIRWGNRGIERLDGFPDGWIANGQPTLRVWQLLSERNAEIGAGLPAPVTPTPIVPAPEPEAAADPDPAADVPSPPTTKGPTTTVAPTTTTPPPVNPGGKFPVYDTAWQMLVRATPQQTDQYFATLSEYGFTGSWTAIIHHAPATYLHRHAGGGQVGRYENGEIILDDGYVAHVRAILDTAHKHGQKVGLVAAWQNTYLPGGNTGSDELSNQVEGTLTTANAYAYGRQIAAKFGDHPAVSQWVFGGDAGTNNTEANKAVWREMARALRDAGMTQPIGYHTPTAHFDQLNYAGEPWLDFAAPETGHNQGPDKTEREIRAAVDAYDVPVWQGESRYFGINFSSWIKPEFKNPGRNEVVADAEAAKRGGVSGYVYGDAGRWAWCLFQNGDGDASPCDPNNIRASFGQAERDVIATFR